MRIPSQPHPILPTMNLLSIDVYYPVPEGWGMCNPCELMMSQASLVQSPEQRGLDEYPPELIEEFTRLSTAIYTLAERFQGQVQIKVWDPRSLHGMWRCIRHGVRRYPTFIIGGQIKQTDLDIAKLEQAVHSVLETGVSAI